SRRCAALPAPLFRPRRRHSPAGRGPATRPPVHGQRGRGDQGVPAPRPFWAGRDPRHESVTARPRAMTRALPRTVFIEGGAPAGRSTVDPDSVGATITRPERWGGR